MGKKGKRGATPADRAAQDSRKAKREQKKQLYRSSDFPSEEEYNAAIVQAATTEEDEAIRDKLFITLELLTR